MADITYRVNEDAPENIPGFEQYSQNDKELINSFEVNNTFNPSKNYMELHIFSLSDELLESDAEYTNYTQLGNAQSAGSSGASVLTVDPIYDSRIYGYDLGGVKLLYHFLNDLYTISNTTAEFFIESISADRTEVRLLPVSLKDSDVVKFTAGVKNKLETQSYFDGFRLNFKNNDLFIAVNIDTVDLNQGKAVVVKLYEPLPDTYSEKSKLNIVEIISDSAAYEVDSDITMEEIKQPTLRPANFNLEISDESVIPTGYLDYNELFSYPINNANSEIYSLFNEKGIDVSVDFTDYNDFVHFSSAEERLNNFKYKIDLVNNYSASLSSINTTTKGIAGSRTYFENLISGIVSNFDHYERFLYYESGSASWPKSNTTKPYVNIPSANPVTSVPNPTVTAWYSAQLTQAIAFDRTNVNSLVNAIPSYLKDDDNNTNYLTFIYMIGQHFDNLWTYAKAVTDKYDADNRMNHGISKDLVGEALKNFGVKLYTSNKSIEDLFGSLIGQAYQSGSEYITNYIVATPTGSNTPIQPAGFDNYQKEIQKRIYHNLPLLLKSKGTERGVRALINCFGIPADTLQIKYYGGRNTNTLPFFGDYSYYTSSLDKVRLDNTGSTIPGDTLSGNTSNIKRDPKYTDDLHSVEIGFSPTDNIDKLIVSYSMATASLSTFNIDQYIGDPRNLTSNTYDLLDTLGDRISDLTDITNTIMSSSAAYNVFDYVRLIKFFDNTVFKTIKDFIPARVVADTGIIIKPHLLSRSKAKSVTTTGTDVENLFTGSIDTAFISGTHGNTFGSRDQYSAAYRKRVQTPFGLGISTYHNQQEAKYDGELTGSQISVTNGELTEDNIYLDTVYVESTDYLHYISASTSCDLVKVDPSPRLVNGTDFYLLDQFFAGYASSDMVYELDPIDPPGAPFPITWPRQFTGFQQYDTFIVQAENTAASPCEAFVECVFGTCDISPKPITSNIGVLYLSNLTSTSIDLLETYFSIGGDHDDDQLEVTLIINEGTIYEATYNITGAQARAFTSTTIDYLFDANDTLTIVVTDTGLAPAYVCRSSNTILAAKCTLAQQLPTTVFTKDYIYNPDNAGQVFVIDVSSGITNEGVVGKFYRITLDPITDGAYFSLPTADNVEIFGTVIAGGYPTTFTNTFEGNPVQYVFGGTLTNPGFSPIHHKEYQYPQEDSTKDMTVAFPYLTNPNYIFENVGPDGNPNGTARDRLPVLRNGPTELSDLSGYQVGLASFFTGLGNLNEVHYEVFIYRVENIFARPYDGNNPSGDFPTGNALVFAATDYEGDGIPYTVGGIYDIDDIQNGYLSPDMPRTRAIRPGSSSVNNDTQSNTFSDGYALVNGNQVPIWTYNIEAYNSGTNTVPGYVAMLNIDALQALVGFGEEIVFTNSASNTGYAYYVRIYAYTLEPTTPPLYEQDFEPYDLGIDGPQVTEWGFLCQAGASVVVESWIKTPGGGSGNTGDDQTGP